MTPAQLTILVTASGAPGTAALVRALRLNGERPVRVVGCDMQPRAIGVRICDAFALVPAGANPGYGAAMIDLCARERVDVVIPQASADLPGLAAVRDELQSAGTTAIVSAPEVVRRADDKHETILACRRSGVRAPESIIVRSARELAAAAGALGYPGRAVCMKPLVSAGSRGFRVLSPDLDRRMQLLDARPGDLTIRLEDVVEILGPDPVDLLVMEVLTGGEITVDGFARGGEVALACAKTRESIRAGLAMAFETVDRPDLVDATRRLVAELGIDGFFNLQFMGDHVLEINPRISTIVYQEDFNLAWLGVRHAVGDLPPGEAAQAQARIRPGRFALRYYDQAEWDLRPT